ncbi:hypothetical protein [Rhizobium sp. NRK18]|uniref:hypothetical protein n=1 Tax=Rhizobium sp. NRK18 TaxID=2964667 RepID=UPI0021C2FC23|nr:hypothetical protein [Rhizobium sp. NRK18]MCQ2005130.1 hypothetical protein [Rhizobium sp. NRK18]
MLTKKQTLLAVPFLLLTFVGLCLLGYISDIYFHARGGPLAVIFGAAFAANFLAGLFIFFSIFASMGTAMISNASGPDWFERTGNPFYYLLWKELRDTTIIQTGQSTVTKDGTTGP